MEGMFSNEKGAQISDSGGPKRGGWITFPFIVGTVTGLTLAGGGWASNLIVYLIEEFNIESVDAAQVSNVVNGCINLFPVLGAIIADSCLGSFTVIFVSSCISLLGIILITLTSSLDSLRPSPCEVGSRLFQSPSKLQFAILYSGIALAAIGLGGTRFTVATMGANQFDKPRHQGIFFNWYFFAIYASSVVSATGLVYIEDNISWRFGFGLSIAANLVGLVAFLLGSRYYLRDEPQGSPFTSLARVVVATLRKRKAILSSTTTSEDYYQEEKKNNGLSTTNVVNATPGQNFRFLNRAALKTKGDIQPDGMTAKPWRLCTVQQVEDFKALIKIFPLWSSSIFLSVTIGIQASLTVLQALVMDRHIGPHFKIPAGSILVIVFITTSIFLTMLDRLLCPLWNKLTHHSPTPLQLIGLGHMLNAISMAVSALVESHRLKIVHAHNMPMLALWLFPQLVLVGIGEAFHFPGQVSLYYQEFPPSLRSTATAMIALIVGIGFYLSTALIDLVRRVTPWLPNNINNGRLDNVYWTLVVVSVINFGYYLVCSMLYNYRNVVDEKKKDVNGGDTTVMGDGNTS